MVKPKGTAKKKVCKTGHSCGAACISKKKVCRKSASGQNQKVAAEDFAAMIRKYMGEKSGGPTIRTTGGGGIPTLGPKYDPKPGGGQKIGQPARGIPGRNDDRARDLGVPEALIESSRKKWSRSGLKGDELERKIADERQKYLDQRGNIFKTIADAELGLGIGKRRRKSK